MRMRRGSRAAGHPQVQTVSGRLLLWTCVVTLLGDSNAKESSNYCTIALISYASKVMLKILRARLQQYIRKDPRVPHTARRGA